MNKKKSIMISILALALIMGSTSVLGISSVNAEEITNPKKETSVEVNKKVDSTKINDLVFTLIKVSQSNSNGMRDALKGSKFICVDLNVNNKGVKQEQMTSMMIFRMVDQNKKQYNIVLPEGPGSFNGLVNPGKVMKGKVWFEVPEKDNSFKLYIKPSMASEKNGIIDINLEDDIIENNNTDNSFIEIQDNTINNKEETVKSSFELKDSVKIDNITFKVKKVSTSDCNSLGEAGEGYDFLNIELSARNDGKKEEQITSIMTFKLIDENGHVYNIVLPEDRGINDLLKPGKELSGKISFKIKEENRNFKLEIKPWLMKNLKEYVKINI